MSNVSTFITEELFKRENSNLQIDVFGEVLKSLPHIVGEDGNFRFTEADCRHIRRVIGFIVSAQFGNNFMEVLGMVCRGDMDKVKIGLEYFTSVTEITQFIGVCNILNVHVDTESTNDDRACFVLYKKGDALYG